MAASYLLLQDYDDVEEGTVLAEISKAVRDVDESDEEVEDEENDSQDDNSVLAEESISGGSLFEFLSNFSDAINESSGTSDSGSSGSDEGDDDDSGEQPTPPVPVMFKYEALVKFVWKKIPYHNGEEILLK